MNKNVIFFNNFVDCVVNVDYVLDEEIRFILLKYFFGFIFDDEDDFGFCFLEEIIFEGFYLIYKCFFKWILYIVNEGYVIIFFKESLWWSDILNEVFRELVGIVLLG